MNTETLYDAITEVKDELVDAAARVTPAKGRTGWLKLGSIAAALAVLAGLGAWGLRGRLPGLGTSMAPGGSQGGQGHDGGSEFMSYAGPVFPLTALEGDMGLTASRELTYDFSPWAPVWRSNEDEANSRSELTEDERQEVLRSYNEWYPEGGRYLFSRDLLVTDAYTLANPTGEDKTITLLYPFAANLNTLAGLRPVLSADGTELETTLRVGGYSGGFQGAMGSEEAGSLNLDSFHSWEEYRALLGDGSYQAHALEGFPDLSSIPVTAYEFTNAWAPEELPACIQVQMELDYSKTTILTHGFTGGSFDREAGLMKQDFWVPDPGLRGDGPFLLFVLGEPVSGMELHALPNGDSSSTDYLELGVEAGVDMDTYETDLESALRMAAEAMYDTRSWEDIYGEVKRPDFELFFGLLKEDLLTYGPLSDTPMERYDYGGLDFMDTAPMERVFYLEAAVTVPAGGSVTVEASFTKAPSYDFYCARTENQGVYGYDMVTQLGTGLDITAQTAAAVNTQYTRIVRQNYGFDWENGVDKVALDPSVEHYFLEVCPAGG